MSGPGRDVARLQGSFTKLFRLNRLGLRMRRLARLGRVFSQSLDPAILRAKVLHVVSTIVLPQKVRFGYRPCIVAHVSFTHVINVGQCRTTISY